MRIPRRSVVDDDVDRSDVEAPQGAALTDTNRPFGLAKRGAPCRVVDTATVRVGRFQGFEQNLHALIGAKQADRVGACRRELEQVSGDYCGGVTPDPIPNSEVKPSRA